MCQVLCHPLKLSNLVPYSSLWTPSSAKKRWLSLSYIGSMGWQAKGCDGEWDRRGEWCLPWFVGTWDLVCPSFQWELLLLLHNQNCWSISLSKGLSRKPKTAQVKIFLCTPTYFVIFKEFLLPWCWCWYWLCCCCVLAASRSLVAASSISAKAGFSLGVHMWHIRHTCLFLGSGDALVGWLQILVCLALKLSLVILDEVPSPLTLSLHPFSPPFPSRNSITAVFL